VARIVDAYEAATGPKRPSRTASNGK